MTQHFNGLTEAQAERLAILAEECAEVIQVVGKILRHGLESTNPLFSNAPTNRQLLAKELGDLSYATDMVKHAGDVDSEAVTDAWLEKVGKIHRYLHHQPTEEPALLEEVPFL
jgi:NTP pyrophosphatase (non-canonical NTP hydrolase)